MTTDVQRSLYDLIYEAEMIEKVLVLSVIYESYEVRRYRVTTPSRLRSTTFGTAVAGQALSAQRQG